jgi:hypothetical protein
MVANGSGSASMLLALAGMLPASIRALRQMLQV